MELAKGQRTIIAAEEMTKSYVKTGNNNNNNNNNDGVAGMTVAQLWPHPSSMFEEEVDLDSGDDNNGDSEPSAEEEHLDVDIRDERDHGSDPSTNDDHLIGF